MARPQKKHDRIAFLAFTSLALGIVVVMWVWNVRSVVGDGVRGTREVFTDVTDVASQVRRQTEPSQETVDAIKESLKGIVAGEETAPVAEDPGALVDPADVDAVAQLMKNDVETYGQEPKN